MPLVTLKQLLEAGVHFGHQTSRWNPKMKRYIFTARNGIHIIDLQQTVKLLDDASNWVKDVVGGGRLGVFIAITEARKLGIPIVAITDSNCDPDEIDHVIPGNDDAIRAVKLITSKIADAALEARQLISPEELTTAPEVPATEFEFGGEEEEEEEKSFAGMPTVNEAEFYEDEALDDEK